MLAFPELLCRSRQQPTQAPNLTNVTATHISEPCAPRDLEHGCDLIMPSYSDLSHSTTSPIIKLLLAALWGSCDKLLPERCQLRLTLLSNAWLQTAMFVYGQDKTHVRVKRFVNEVILLLYCKLNLVTVQEGLLSSPEEVRKEDQPLELIQIKVPVLQPG